MFIIKKLINRFYNQEVEDFCTRLLYFFNTIDTYAYLVGAFSFFAYLYYFQASFSVVGVCFLSLAVFCLYRICDFYPLFVLLSPVYLFFLIKVPAFDSSVMGFLLLMNFVAFLAIQICFMGFPDSIVARDPTISLRKIWNSIFTIAPTAVSLSMSFFFSTLFSLVLVFAPNPSESNGLFFWISASLAAVITYRFKPKSFVSDRVMPEIKAPLTGRVIILNIDGCRLDRFNEAKLPFLTSLQKVGTCLPNGLITVYRALTNPAFASILTGTRPEIHGIRDNNLGQKIKVEGLPDVVKSKLYGSMHVKHFSKPEWETKIVSLPTHGIYKSDDIMLDLLKEDLRNEDGTRFYVADLSEVDFLGHAYGSESTQYLDAMKRADQRIKEFFEFLKAEGLDSDTVTIICSDHGMVRIDHSYLLFDAEKYVPFIIAGRGIKENNQLTFKASIMDITPTISYLLGVRYPDHCEGRVFMEAFS